MAKGAPDYERVFTLVTPVVGVGAPDWERTAVGPGGTPIAGSPTVLDYSTAIGSDTVVTLNTGPPGRSMVTASSVAVGNYLVIATALAIIQSGGADTVTFVVLPGASGPATFFYNSGLGGYPTQGMTVTGPASQKIGVSFGGVVEVTSAGSVGLFGYSASGSSQAQIDHKITSGGNTYDIVYTQLSFMPV